MSGFDRWSECFERQEMGVFTSSPEALLWLKIRTIVRRDLLEMYSEHEGYSFSGSKQEDRFRELYELMKKNVADSHRLLDGFIRHASGKLPYIADKDRLIDQLYQIETYKWGGDADNSLDRFLVSRYVKPIRDLNQLKSKFRAEIDTAVHNYVLSSWYNHWTSRLIEQLFIENDGVLPALGKVKSVDFFIKQVPFDFKVTFLPNEFRERKRKDFGFKSSLSILKKAARRLSIVFDEDRSKEELKDVLSRRLCDNGSEIAVEALNMVSDNERKIVDYALNNKAELIKWLYEHQGSMRFGAENRIFIILIDREDLSSSWKLKRNVDLLRPEIKSFVDGFDSTKLKGMRTVFMSGGRQYEAFADIIYILK